MKIKTFHRNLFVLSKQPFPVKAKQSWPAQPSFLHALPCLQDRKQLKGLQKHIVLNRGEQKLGLSTRGWDLCFDSFIFRRLRLFLNLVLDSAAVASTVPTFSSPAVPHPYCLLLLLGHSSLRCVSEFQIRGEPKGLLSWLVSTAH